MQPRTPEQLRPLFARLEAAASEVDLVIVGGQAVNLWALRYCKPDDPQWQQWLPYASEDLDLLGSKLDVLALHDVLGGELYLSKDFDASPNSGIILLPENAIDTASSSITARFRVDVLATLFGLSEVDARNSALRLTNADLPIQGLRVLHPILCLEGKLKNLYHLPQEQRQDRKHLALCILTMNAFLQEQLGNPAISPKPVLKLVERIADTATTDAGLAAWYQHQLDVLQAIPIEAIATQEAEALQRFLELRWPQLSESIERKRDRYSQLMQAIASRQGQG